MTTVAGAATRLAVLGAGTVGSALLRRLSARSDVEVNGVLVRDANRARDLGSSSLNLVTDPARAVEGADVVVELLGGTGLALELMLESLAAGRKVITGNKAALAEHWDEFLPYLRQGQLYFEAAVMAGTPAVAPIASVLRGSEPLRLDAVLNGTCSFMIGRLADGLSFDEALAEAQELGYAEADPSLDVGGFDAAHKLAILGRLAFDPELSWTTVKAGVRGITGLTPESVAEAVRAGGSVTLLCSIEPVDGAWVPRVRPVQLPAGHELGGLGADRNGFVFNGRHSGKVFVSGPGAGGDSTASAVLGDLEQALAGRAGPAPLARAATVPSGEPAEVVEL